MLLQVSDDVVVNLEHCAKIERRKVENNPRVTFTFSDGLTAKTIDDPGWKLWAKVCNAAKPRAAPRRKPEQ